MDDWRFDDPPDTLAIATRQVLARTEDILLVTHERDDGVWVFIGGPWRDADLQVVCLSHALECDASVGALATLPLGWGAKRTSLSSPWEWFELPPEGE